MKLFREYFLDSAAMTKQTLYLPKDANVIKVSPTNKGLALLAIVTPEEYSNELPELRTFKICVNEENLYTDTVKYIGSFESNLGIKHLIEIIKEY